MSEYEKLDSKWIDEHKETIFDLDEDFETEFIKVDDLKNLLVPKQEELEAKIQELIEVYKQEEDAYSNPENGWIGGFIENLKNLLEEEQKYYVIDKEDNILLLRGYEGIEKADNLKIFNSGGGALKLTEQEIKDYDPRYWPFAVKVEELEE